MPGHLRVIGIDIGGTKIKAAAVEVIPGGLGGRIIVSQQVETPRMAPAAFYDAVAALVRPLLAGLSRSSSDAMPVVAVAHPGRFLPDGTLARATTPNLGSAPGQFDRCAPARELARRLQTQVVVENDAVAQMRFGLGCLLRDPAVRPSLLGQTVVYLGPGTGMGGGVARVSAAGDVIPVTDGHFFDLQVPGHADGTLTAEEIFTGPAIARYVEQVNHSRSVPIQPARGGRLDELLTTPGADADQRAEAERIADVHGEILAAVIRTIHAGRITKVRLERRPGQSPRRHIDEPDRAWSQEDQRCVLGAERFLFGGFVGCSRGLGGRIRARALARLRTEGLPGVEIFQIPAESADAGLLGIVTAIPESRLTA